MPIVRDAGGRSVEVRWSRQRKAGLVMALLAGDSPERLSAEHDVSISRLLRWRDAFVVGGTEALKGMP